MKHIVVIVLFFGFFCTGKSQTNPDILLNTYNTEIDSLVMVFKKIEADARHRESIKSKLFELQRKKLQLIKKFMNGGNRSDVLDSINVFISNSNLAKDSVIQILINVALNTEIREEDRKSAILLLAKSSERKALEFLVQNLTKIQFKTDFLSDAGLFESDYCFWSLQEAKGNWSLIDIILQEAAVARKNELSYMVILLELFFLDTERTKETLQAFSNSLDGDKRVGALKLFNYLNDN